MDRVELGNDSQPASSHQQPGQMSRSLSALVIGNAKYAHASKLKNPGHDAEDVAEVLERCGFDVTLLNDATHRQMDKTLKRFKATLADQDVGLFFFAGHGFQIDGDNYLAAVDTEVEDEIDAKHSSLSLNRVIAQMEKTDTSTNIIILDACRDNPFERSWHRGVARGLAAVYAPRGTMIAFSTSPGQFADDGKGRNGAYTAALLEHIDAQDCSIEAMFKRVRNTLSAATSGKQISWEHTSLAGEFYFNLGIAKLITEYGPTALSDALFVLDEARTSHKAIKKLKSLTWPTQNPAIDTLKGPVLAKFATDSLFVLGRNIYQSACGHSNSAVGFINAFADRTTAVPGVKRKALLDGMLFEIFFDSAGEVRDDPKDDKFNEVFALQKHKEFADSFAFISRCLLPEIGRFHVLPGKEQPTAVDVTLDAKADNAVKKIFVGGANVLGSVDADFKEGDKIVHRTLDRDDFEDWIARQLVIPRRLLTFSYGKPAKGIASVRFPYGWSCRMPT
ncbi:caspase family protein [Croceicoccus marinus]